MLSAAQKKTERRYSARWPSGRGLQWRLHRGRRHMRGLIRERSLNGLVIEVPSAEAPVEGDYLLPASSQIGDRHGFRQAIVRRRDTQGPQSVLFVEILA